MSGKRKPKGQSRPTSISSFSIPEQPEGEYPIGRIVLESGKFSPKQGGKLLLNTLKYNWPGDSKVDFLITPGAYLTEDLPNELGQSFNGWEATPEDIEFLKKHAQKNVEDMLGTNQLLNHVEGKTKYITIGSDIWTYDEYKAELVFLIDVKKGKVIHWTGKSYPTQDEESYVVQVSDLCTHCKKLPNHRVLILGCHDLHMYNHRPGIKNRKTYRAKHKLKMKKITKEFDPTIVIQHPHTTESPRVWRGAWGSLMKDFPEVKHWASAIRHHDEETKKFRPIDEVLRGSKSEENSTLDVMLKIS